MNGPFFHECLDQISILRQESGDEEAVVSGHETDFCYFVRQAWENKVRKLQEDMEGRLRVGGERRCGVERHGCL